MKQSPAVLLYPVKDVAGSKELYKRLLGVEPYVDSAYYVGFRVADLEIGLAPIGPKGWTGPAAFWDVDDIKKSLQLLLDAGFQGQEDVRNVGGGMLVASVKDADGNVIGLRQSP
jgi:catechol 2,3-dioxygenase-like lactoylglutathione lyase family enzyme